LHTLHFTPIDGFSFPIQAPFTEDKSNSNISSLYDFNSLFKQLTTINLPNKLEIRGVPCKHNTTQPIASMALTTLTLRLKLCSKLMEGYPNGASLSPSLGSLPLTPKTNTEMEDFIIRARQTQALLPTTDGKWWRWEHSKLDMKARLFEMQYRSILYDEKLGDQERREKLSDIMGGYLCSREKWCRRTEVYLKCVRGGKRMKQEESGRAMKYGGLVHIVCLEESLDDAVNQLKAMGEESWHWVPWTREKCEKYFGNEDEYIDDDDDMGSETATVKHVE
jgi:hypothetical protein